MVAATSRDRSLAWTGTPPRSCGIASRSEGFRSRTEGLDTRTDGIASRTDGIARLNEGMAGSESIAARMDGSPASRLRLAVPVHPVQATSVLQ